MKQTKQQLVAQELLEKIKYPLIHFADHLRLLENPESKLGDCTINLLTALESIGAGVARFFPVWAKCILHQDNYQLSVSSNQYILNIAGIEKGLVTSLDKIKNPGFSSNDKDNTIASLKLLQESKTILGIPISAKTDSLYYGICAYGGTPKSSSTLTNFFHAKNFPCFQSFQLQYQHVFTDSLSDYARIISHSIFNNKTKNIMDDLIKNKEIDNFRKVLTYTFHNPDTRSATILKENFKIDLQKIISILNDITPLNLDLQKIIVSYTCPI